ncbi:MAG: sigma-70 family RNA polymerase sigma factor [Clostridia bacterium]|nr:sigma-70 family RNA polymerase sigma factor [Clostridia bacterium]
MKELNEVKKDLKNLKKHAHAIERLQKVVSTHEARIKMLKRMKDSEKTRELIKKEESLLDSIKLCEEIDNARHIEEKYMHAILALDPVDKSIILDTYINGEPYWKIGLELGFSEESIRKKVSKIIKTIALSV